MSDAIEDPQLAAAEARRQRILAKSKDRLARVTYGDPAPSTSATRTPLAPSQSEPSLPAVPPQCSPADTAAEPGPVSSAAQAPVPPPSAAASQPPPPQPHAPAQSPSPRVPPPTVPPAALPRRPAAAEEPWPPADAGEAHATANTSTQSASGTAGPALAGQELALAVRETRLLRTLVSVLLAFCLFTGRVDPGGLLRIPPVIILILSQVAVILGTRWFLSSPVGRSYRARLAPLSDALLPVRLRAFSAPSLVPGLPALLASITSARAFSAGVAEGVSLFLFTYAALHWTL